MKQGSRTKISTQQVPRRKSIRKKLHEQNQCKSFMGIKINMHQASRTKISTQQVS